ncbi:uncharacterized protein LOC103703509 [Phoenix dactylifera]|uniref:Uncharacterized protein LOC103703509 n=1 Tax=Phoenix dactylifera TaxID=42345 RepID=A0A8B7BSY2_PHODC|nr:uncharacterized protein LOC103703509 [Phoenix dactylifera]
MAGSVEQIKLGLRSLVPESKTDSSSFHSSGVSSGQAGVIIQRAPGRVVSLSTCSKMCAVSLMVGVFIGFTLKRRLRQWAGKLLKRLKDD